MTITIEKQGRRFYFLGNTFPIKDQLRASGAKWDAEKKAWWTAKADVAASFTSSSPAASTSSDTPAAPSSSPTREAPGEDAKVAGRATYKGKTYYLAGRVARGRTIYDDRAEAVTTRDGAKFLLYSRDGKLQFWAARESVQVIASYQKPKTIASLRRYAEEHRTGERRPGSRYECDECGEWVTAGSGSCWETGAAH